LHTKSYQKSRIIAWETLLRYDVRSLPVVLHCLMDQMGIRYYNYESGAKLISAYHIEHLCQNDGFTLLIHGRPFILYNNSIQPRQRIRFTIAHELGHILCGHSFCASGGVLHTRRNRGDLAQGDPREYEANCFAMRLLSPSIVLHRIGVRSPEEIALLCGLSPAAAQCRAGRMAVLESRNNWLRQPLERRVDEQFAAFCARWRS